MVSKKDVLQVLRTVLDPELALSIVDLGLVYAVKISGPKNQAVVGVKMTLTTPFCPMAPQINEQVKAKVLSLKGVSRVEVDLVWEPHWTPDKMSEQAKIELGLV